MIALIAKLSGLTLARFVGAAGTFLATLLIARLFGAEVMADYAVAMAAVGVVAVLLPLGTQAFASVLTAEYAATNRPGLVHGLVRRGHQAIVALAGVIALAVASAWFWPLPIRDSTLAIAVGVAAIAPAVALLLFNAAVLNGLQRPGEAQLPDTLLRPALVLAGLLAAVALTVDNATPWVLAAMAVATWVAALVQFRYVRRALADMDKAPIGTEGRRWRKMIPPWLSIALLWDYAIELHLLIAALIVAPVEIALLHVCFRFRVLAGFGMRSIYAVCTPKIATACATDDGDAATQMIGLTNLLSLAYGLAIFFGLWLFGPTLLSAFGAEYEASLGLLLILAATVPIRAVFGPALGLLAIGGHQRAIAGVLIGGMAMSLAGCFALTPVLGVTGIGWAYTGTNAVTAVILWWVALKKTGYDTAIWAALPWRDMRARRPLTGLIGARG